MDNAARDKLRFAIKEARQLVENDFCEQLEGIFGISSDGKALPDESLTNLSWQQRSGRQVILAAIVHFGGNQKSAQATARFIREAAFTTLNRLAALKLMEAGNRRLIRESVGVYRDSSGFKEFRQVSPELCQSFADEGYEFYISLLFDSLSEDLGFLFDRTLPQGILFPSQPCLRSILAVLNELPADIWQEDETIGWIYQFFTPPQLRDQARKESSAPRNSYELSFRNQFYTPRYVVEFLVDNTLGRMWLEMRQGHTILVDQCQYLIHSPNQPIPYREKRDPRCLRALDPGCGSAHFLLYGFDLFETIYNEAYTDPDLGPLLQKDYPTQLEFQRAIPELILSHNLYGIDIDLRAVQIAGLALWLRAQRSYNQMNIKSGDRPRISNVNIVLAEPMPGEKDLIQTFLQSLDNPVIRDLVEKTWQAMQGADEIGSLLKVEQFLKTEIKDAKKAWGRLSRLEQMRLFAPDHPEPKQLALEFDFIDDQKFWETVEGQVLNELRRFAVQAKNGGGQTRRLFVGDAERGFAFIDLLRQPFDLVWMNPPFGAASKGSKEYIEKNYPRTKNDLYAAFVERGLELLSPEGFLGAITSRTGFFLKSFQQWREEILLKEARVIAMADLGSGVLDTAMVETATYVIQKE